MRVALVHSPLALPASTAAILVALRELGHDAVPLIAGPDLLNDIQVWAPDVIFNNAPGIRRKAEQPCIVALLELTGRPFTGSGLVAQIICQQKDLAKQVLRQAGVATADFQPVAADADLDRLPEMAWPVLVKPAAEGSSRGISAASVVSDRAALRRQVAQVRSDFGGTVLVEQFLPGREFTIGVLGQPPCALPPVEIGFATGRFYTHQVKEADLAPTVCPADLDPDLADQVTVVAVAAFRAVGARDYARVDVRLDASGQPMVIEINAQPGLAPGYSDFPKAAACAGCGFASLVSRLLDLALTRA